MLTTTACGQLNWTDAGFVPDHWVVYDVTTSSILATVAAGTLTYAVALSSHTLRVYGADAGGANLTGNSNALVAWQAPVAVNTGSSTLDWSYGCSNPASWQVWSVTSGMVEATVSGATFSHVVSFPFTSYYVVGIDGGGSPVTLPSNAVVPEDPP